MQTQILKVKTDNVSEEKGFNTRYDLGDLRSIVANMKTDGFNPAQPIIARENPDNKGFYIIGSQGHRRIAAAREAELEHVYIVLEQEGLSDKDRNLDIIRLNEGEPLPMLAATRVVMRALEDKEETQGSVAKLIGKSAMFVTDCVKLSKTTKQTQKRIEQDKISAYQVIEIINDLEAKDEKGYEKVEAKVEQLVEKAGDKKVTKKTKDKSEKEEKETEEEREEREAQEKEEAEAKEAQKARLKEWKGYASRVEKFAAAIQELVVKVNNLPEDDQLTPFQEAMLDYQVALASYLTGKPCDTSRLFTDKGEAGKLSDVGAAQRAVEKCHKETLKEEVKEVKTEAKEKLDEVKKVAKETKEEAAKRIKAAKAAVAQA